MYSIFPAPAGEFGSTYIGDEGGISLCYSAVPSGIGFQNQDVWTLHPDGTCHIRTTVSRIRYIEGRQERIIVSSGTRPTPRGLFEAEYERVIGIPLADI